MRLKRNYPQLAYRPNRRVLLDALRFGPLLRLAAVVSIAAAVCGALVFAGVAIRRRAALAQVDALPAQATATPEAAATGSAPGPVHAVVLPAGVSLLADASIADGALLFAAGEADDRFDQIVRVDAASGDAEAIRAPVEYASLRNPVESGGQIAYIDARASGGGAIMLLDRASGAARRVCLHAAEIPALYYEAPYLVWQMRTAEHIEKLVAFNTQAASAVTLTVFGDTAGALSEPSLKSGLVLYADAGADTPDAGYIRATQLLDGSAWESAMDMPVHDPKSFGHTWAWLTGRHGADGDLYYSENGASPVCAARGVVDFGITAGGLVYGKDETVYLYRLSDGETVRLSEPGTRAQLAAVADELALWRDITDAAQPIWKYRRIG